MKKILILLLCFNILSLPAFCAITDDFAEKTLDKTLKVKPVQNVEITDNFVENNLDKNLKIKSHAKSYITDNFAESNKKKNSKIVKSAQVQEVLPAINTKEVKKLAVKKTIVNTGSDVKIPVRIKSNFTTRQSIDEGDYIEFITTQNVVINKKNYPVGTTVKARVENISLNKSMGVPADLLVGNFSLNGIPLKGEINKTGANRSLWVYPCVYILTYAFGAGLLFIPIRGGHAKINPDETFTLYAE